MKSKTKILISAFIVLLLGGVRADWEHYQMLLDSHPFGNKGSDNAAGDAPRKKNAQNSFAKHLRLCTIFEGFDGDVRAGLVDEKNKDNYIIRLGETVKGITLEEVDLNVGNALLKKQGELAMLKLDAGSDSNPALERSPADSSAGVTRQRKRSLRVKRLVAARKKREAELGKKLEGKALKKYLQEYQMEVLRKGLPALPIPLTDEMDKQLVQEGVLPP